MKVIISKEMGLMLYWCEGDKSVETCKIGLTTSDPEMLNYFISWLINYYGIRKSKIKLRLHLWEGSNEEIAKKYWSQRTKITKFTKTWFKPSGKKKKFPYGICRASIDNKKLLTNILNDIERYFHKPYKINKSY